MSAPHMPIINDEGLLECPFCGGNEVYLIVDLVLVSVECEGCCASSGEWGSSETAIRHWNTRNGHLYTADDFNQVAEERDYGL